MRPQLMHRDRQLIELVRQTGRPFDTLVNDEARSLRASFRPWPVNAQQDWTISAVGAGFRPSWRCLPSAPQRLV